MSLPIKNIENVRRNIQAKVGLMRAKLSGMRAQQPLLGQLQVGKGQLIQNLQGKRLLRSLLPVSSGPSTLKFSIRPQMHPGVVDTAGIGKGKPIITGAAVEQEKGAYPVNAEMSIEL